MCIAYICVQNAYMLQNVNEISGMGVGYALAPHVSAPSHNRFFEGSHEKLPKALLHHARDVGLT